MGLGPPVHDPRKKITYHDLPLRNPKRLKVFDKRTDYCIFLPI